MVERDRVAIMRPMATIVNMTRQTHTLPLFGSLDVAGAAEEATPALNDPAITSVQLTARKYGVRTLISEEMLEDTPFNLIQMLAQRAGTGIGVYEDDQYFGDADGTGTNFSDAVTGTAKALAVAGVLGHTDLVSANFQQLKAYRPGSVWFAATNVLGFISGVKTSDGRPRAGP